MRIWVLFSIANEYDQPLANLEAWWSEKPTFELLAKTLGVTVDFKKGNSKIGKILHGEEVRIGNTDYRLEQVNEGRYITN